VSIKVKNKKSKKLEKELTKKISLFDRTPDECLTCKKVFDKKDKEMVTSWYVVVPFVPWDGRCLRGVVFQVWI
jgi:hypothetical protein